MRRSPLLALGLASCVTTTFVPDDSTLAPSAVKALAPALAQTGQATVVDQGGRTRVLHTADSVVPIDAVGQPEGAAQPLKLWLGHCGDSGSDSPDCASADGLLWFPRPLRPVRSLDDRVLYGAASVELAGLAFGIACSDLCGPGARTAADWTVGVASVALSGWAVWALIHFLWQPD